MKLRLLVLFTTFFLQGIHAQFAYDWPIEPGFVAANADVLYSIHAGNSSYIVDIPTNESDCYERVQIGSGHDASCSVPIVSSAGLGHLASTGTIGDSGLSGAVCMDNGGYACISGYLETTLLVLSPTDEITYAWTASRTEGSNYYEFLSVLVSEETEKVAWSLGRRGVSSSGNFTFTPTLNGTYTLRFYVGGYLSSSSVEPRTLAPDFQIEAVHVTSTESRSPFAVPTVSPTGTPSISPTRAPTGTPTNVPTVLCPIGRAGIPCEACPEDTFAAVDNSLECTTCPTGYGTEGTTENTRCLEKVYSSTSHFPAEVPRKCNATWAAALSGNDNDYFLALEDGLANSSEAGECIGAIFGGFLTRRSPSEPTISWGAPAARLFVTGTLISSTTQSATLSLGTRARVVEIEAATIGVVTVPCICDLNETSSCTKVLYFTGDDVFAGTPRPEWVEYDNGSPAVCDSSGKTTVNYSLLPGSSSGRRRLQESPTFGSHGNDVTSSPTLRTRIAPTHWETSILAIVLYSIAGIIALGTLSYITYNCIKVHRESAVEPAPVEFAATVYDFIHGLNQ